MKNINSSNVLAMRRVVISGVSSYVGNTGVSVNQFEIDIVENPDNIKLINMKIY